MATKNMIRTYSDDSCAGSWYQTTLAQASGITSATYLLPPVPIYALGAEVVGSGTLYFSIDTPDVLSAGTGTFDDWDGLASINLAVTGFKYVTTTASGTAKVTVKASGAS